MAALALSDGTSTEPLEVLGPSSYTAQRLQHATPEHLHLTTRRAFIGPIPEGWLKSHRRDWYKRHLHIHYSSRSAAFEAGPAVDRNRRRMTGIEGPSASATYGQSFPQPSNLEDGTDKDEDVDDDELVQSSSRSHRTSRRKSLHLTGGSHDHGKSTAFTDVQSRKSRSSRGSEHNIEDDEDDNAIEDPGLQRLDSPREDGRRTTFDLGPGNHMNFGKVGSSGPRTARTGFSSKTSQKSFVTANERLEDSEDEPSKDGLLCEPRRSASQRGLSPVIGSDTGTNGVEIDTGSNVSLLRDAAIHENKPDASEPSQQKAQAPDQQVEAAPQASTNGAPKSLLKKIKAKISSNDLNQRAQDPGDNSTKVDGKAFRMSKVQFALSDDQKNLHVKQRLAQVKRRGTLRRLKRSKIHDGEIIKMEKMLVRAEYTNYELPSEFGENYSQKIESRIVDKWKEYVVVCRGSSDDSMDFALQLYKTRVIPAVEHVRIKQNSTHSIPLTKQTKINMYSSLDKTMVIWKPWKEGALVYIMKPHSTADAMEWYTFLRNLLGWSRPSVLQINVPGLDVSLRLKNPFRGVESARDLAQAAEGDDDAVDRTMREEEAVASNIIKRCMELLNKSPESKDMIDDWAQGQRIGLAWKRFDRLEWIYGINEKRMYGTMGMEKSHDLELRPKQHYPTFTKTPSGSTQTEPPPVEGFLIRLTSQKGNGQRMGRLFFKRLYFSTHNEWLVFNRPARADPPPSPDFQPEPGSAVPSAHEISDRIPLMYSVNPFPLIDDEIDWLRTKSRLSAEQIIQRDRLAQDEMQRTTNVLMKCDGVFDLTHILKVREVKIGATPVDENIEEGSDVDFDQEVDDTLRDDGQVSGFDQDRTFELVLRNKLVVRLQAFDETTKKEWMKRLKALIKYWKRRRREDIGTYLETRKTNMERLQVDEETEALLGQFAQKWEVTKSVASPVLYHVCGLSHCRCVHLSAVLYRKTRIHAGFEKCLVVLSHGCLLVFRDALRTRSGQIVPHIHHERVGSLDLRDCYVYSGFLTEGDLGAAGMASHNAGRPDRLYGLPRRYTEDGWSSIDEDTTTTFVIWHGKRRTWFRSEQAGDQERKDMLNDQGKLKGRTKSGGMLGKKHGGVKLVSRLGVTGSHMVFKTRSRAERDHWVMSVAMEIERLGTQSEDIRLTGKNKIT